MTNLAKATVVHHVAMPTQREFVAHAQDIARQTAIKGQLIAPMAGTLEMSVRITNAGALGWVADAKGYRYTPTHPLTGKPWPTIPDAFLELATEVGGDHPWDCAHLVWYARGAGLGWHRDKTESDIQERRSNPRPIVTVSLGDQARWGVRRSEQSPIHWTDLMSGDVTLLAGDLRSAPHTIASIEPAGLFAPSPLVKPGRLAISIRCAG